MRDISYPNSLALGHQPAQLQGMPARDACNVSVRPCGADFLSDRKKSKWLASLAAPWVKFVDQFCGEKARSPLWFSVPASALPCDFRHSIRVSVAP